MNGPALIADMGGTNVRSSATRWRHVDMHAMRHSRSHDGRGLPGGARDVRPVQAAFAVASPITGDIVEMTNSAWKFSVHHVQRQLGLGRLQVVNDFTATALSVPHLGPDHLMKLGGAAAVDGAAIAVLGPGTGLGVSGLVRDRDGRWMALSTEAGTSPWPPPTTQAQVLAHLRRRFVCLGRTGAVGTGPVEPVRGGGGGAGMPASFSTAEAVSSHGQADRAACRQALSCSSPCWGRGGNLALSLRARGGIYVAGGILRIAQAFFASDFRRRFESGPLRRLSRRRPTWLVIHPEPAFAGLAALTRDADRPGLASPVICDAFPGG